MDGPRQTSEDAPRNTLLVCDCEGTMPLDARALGRACGADITLHTGLCRAQLPAFVEAARQGGAQGGRLTVCCTQEAPLFGETLDQHAPDTEARYVNIRERAGWSDDAGDATPKIAALIAEAAIEVAPARALTLKSDGRALVYGRDEAALAAAAQLAGRLSPTVILIPPGDALPLATTTFPVFRGTVAELRGHFGAFVVAVDGLSAVRPSSRGGLAFEPAGPRAELSFDLVIDLTGAAPLVSAPEKRDGYFRPDPGNPAAVQKALFEAADMVGEFEKPIYVDFDANLCAHARSGIVGCQLCLDACPASAITPAGDVVAIDQNICAGCGACASVCPTGAASYTMPSGEVIFRRLRTLLRAYAEAGGRDAVLLVADTRHGEDMIGAIARYGRGLPARVLPFAVNEITQLGFDFLATALAYGANRVVLLAPPGRADELDGLATQIAFAEAALSGLGFDAGRIRLIDETDPDAVSEMLYALEALAAIPASEHLPMGGKRTLSMMALEHLHGHAPSPADIVALPEGAPFGAVTIDEAGCTLCLACVGACPVGALTDNPDSPMLRFIEQTCVQCGLCRNTCPESVITLQPRFNFTAEARQEMLLKEEPPFECIECGKPFAPRAAIERTIERLAGHPMFADDPAAMDRLRMCEDCRVTAQFADPQPLSGGPVRITRTTDDYLAGRVGDDDDEDD